MSSFKFLALTSLLNAAVVAGQGQHLRRIQSNANSTMSPTATPACAVSSVSLLATTDNPIQLFELEVFSSETNVALSSNGGSASQSTTHKGDDVKFGPGNAIDGQGTSFIHTAPGPGGKLTINLSNPSLVDRVTIKNRWCGNPTDPNKCLCRLTGAKLVMSDAGGNSLFTRTLGDTCDKDTITESFAELDCSKDMDIDGCSVNEAVYFNARIAKFLDLFGNASRARALEIYKDPAGGINNYIARILTDDETNWLKFLEDHTSPGFQLTLETYRRYKNATAPCDCASASYSNVDALIYGYATEEAPYFFPGFHAALPIAGNPRAYNSPNGGQSGYSDCYQNGMAKTTFRTIVTYTSVSPEPSDYSQLSGTVEWVMGNDKKWKIKNVSLSSDDIGRLSYTNPYNNTLV